MKYEAELYLRIRPKVNRQGEITGAQITETFKKPNRGCVRLVISVPESWLDYDGPTIKAELSERQEEVWNAYELEAK